MIFFEPLHFSGQGIAARAKRTEPRTTDRREIGMPVARGVRLDVRCTAYVKMAECGQIDRFVVETFCSPVELDNQLHGLKQVAGVRG